MNPYLCPPEQPERDFIAALKARGFKRPAEVLPPGIHPRSTLIRGDVWVGYIHDRAGIFGWGRGWQPFEVVLATIDAEPEKS